MTKKIAIIGAGLMGASSAYQLAKLAHDQGEDVAITVFEHSSEGVQRGGSMGQARITRLTTRDLPPLCREMIENSNKVAVELGAATPVHALTIGNYEEKLDPAIRSAAEMGVRHTLLQADAIGRKYPFMNAAGFTAVDEEPMTAAGDGAGTINPHALIQKLLQEAAKSGATVRYGTPIAGIHEGKDGVAISTAAGETLHFDKVISAAGVWTSKLIPNHPVSKKLVATVEPLYLFKAPDAAALDALPVMMLKVKGGEKFAREHADFVKKYPRFSQENSSFQAYIMREPAEDGAYLKIGVFVPLETSPKDPDVLLSLASVTPEQQKFAADVVTEFLPGIAQNIPAIAMGKPDKVMFGPYANAPDYTPIISPLQRGSNITVIAADAGTSAKFAIESGKYAAAFALDAPELVPEAARNIFSIDREMQSVAMAEQSPHMKRRLSPQSDRKLG